MSKSAQFRLWLSERWFFLRSFFPLYLFFLHLRRSHLLLLFWILLFGFITGWLGEDYGFKFLFLSPEYLGEVGFWSYFILGITLGLFIMAFHINSYIYYSHRFPFLATLNRPLWKFSVNNFLIPVVFFSVLIVLIINFSEQEGLGIFLMIKHLAGLFLGTAFTVTFALSYFISTIRNWEDDADQKPYRGQLETLRKLVKSRKRAIENDDEKVQFYLKNFWTVKLTRPVKHYDKARLLETIDQHHLSAAFFFLLLILIIVILSLVNPNRYFRIPAGATVFLIFSLYLMIIGAVYSRFKSWTPSLALFLLILFSLDIGIPQWHKYHYAYGMDYQAPAVAYNYEVLDSLTGSSHVERDRKAGLERLKKWRANFPAEADPHLHILNVSGGGLRSTLWTLKVLQGLDSLSKGRLYPQIHLITGSSGGMLGAAFYRELKYRSLFDSSIAPNHAQHRLRAANDLLNPVTFTLAVNDLFFRLRNIELGGQEYAMDRGYSFDRSWSENTYGWMDQPFVFRQQQEAKAEVPMLILAPTVVGDGRKLIMSPQNLSFLTFARPLPGTGKTKEYDGVEFRRLFRRHDADSLNFNTALRLSASFPYITPLVNLPSDPEISLIDAGVRDNEGLELAFRYLYHYRDWLAEHTAGVKVIQIKANRPDDIPINDAPRSRVSELFEPIGGVISSFSNLQIFSKALLMQYSDDFLGLEVELFRFSLLEKPGQVSLSWHLTEKEKREVERAFNREDNVLVRERLLNKKSRPPQKE